MARFNLSIGTRLALFATLFVAIIAALALVSATRLIVIDQKAQSLDHKFLTSTQMLGELSDQISEFRLAESYRASAQDTKGLQAADDLANIHRDTIEKIEAQYTALMGSDIVADELDSFKAAWNTYLAGHQTWVAATPGSIAAEVQGMGSLQPLYEHADAASDRLIDANHTAAQAERATIDQLSSQTIFLVLAASGLAVLLGVLAVVRLRATIIRPIKGMTQALSALAAGDRNIEVPERYRTDEIGQMAAAFEVFRANAFALEEAHAATEAAQQQAQALARHDALTGLPNRRVFSSELDTAMHHVDLGDKVASVLSIDLDRFKPVNDLQGHGVGDTVLCIVSERLRKTVRANDTVARLGGDEFAIVGEWSNDGHAEGLIRLAGRVLSAIGEPISVGDVRLEIGASIGIASYPADGVDAEAIMRAADIAMYRAKHDGRGQFCFFEQSMDEELRSRAALESDLRKAVANQKIVPFYQPLVDMQADRIYGFEVLARWHHPERGQVPPDVFIPIAEQLGLISDLTNALLRQACRDAADWDRDLRISLNISPVELTDAALPARLLTILNQEDFLPSRLEIEITESALVSDLETAKQILTALQAIGIKISLDDFGTGYSSLYHLRQMNFDKVKIDRSFVQSMFDDAGSEKIIDAILSLAHSIGLPTVAEGIETPEVLKQLADKGCEYGQGYYYGKAMSADSVGKVLSEGMALKLRGNGS